MKLRVFISLYAKSGFIKHVKYRSPSCYKKAILKAIHMNDLCESKSFVTHTNK